MANDQIQGPKHRFLLINRRFAAKIALIVGVVSCLGAALVLIFITGEPEGSYGAASRHYSQSLQHLTPTLLAAWLILMLFFGIVTWLISLYTSHYIAGPLYRFMRNMETFIEQGLVTPVPTRNADQLKQEEQQIRRSVAKLQQHYGEIRAVTEGALSQHGLQLADSISKLKELDREAHL